MGGWVGGWDVPLLWRPWSRKRRGTRNVLETSCTLMMLGASTCGRGGWVGGWVGRGGACEKVLGDVVHADDVGGFDL